jgi:hypothetical protein
MAKFNIICDNSIGLFAPGGRTKGALKKSKFQNRLFKFYAKTSHIFIKLANSFKEGLDGLIPNFFHKAIHV